MSTRLFLILTIIFSLLQGSFLPPVLFEGILILLYVLSKNFKTALLFVFLVGIIFDLVQSQHLGLSSLIFVAFASLIQVLRSELPLQRPLFLAILVTLFSLLRSKIIFGDIPIIGILFTFAVAFLVLQVFQTDLRSSGKIKI